MEYYFILKLIHVISATVILGTGSGIAFFMLMAYLNKDIPTLANTSRFVVLADWLFTMPAVIVQFTTGLLLMYVLNYSFQSAWFYWVMGLFIFVGLCWLPVLFLQYQFKNLTRSLKPTEAVPNLFHRYMKLWIILGCFGFSGVLAIFYMMIFKPAL